MAEKYNKKTAQKLHDDFQADGTTSGSYADRKALELPRKHTDMKTVLSYVNKMLEEAEKKAGLNPSRGVATTHIKVLMKMYDIAMRDHFEDIETIKCKSCGKMTHITCEHCGVIGEIKLPNDKFEKNSCEMLKKLADKFYPTLAQMSVSHDVSATISDITNVFVGIISKYIPSDKRNLALSEIHNALLGSMRAIEADYEIM